MADFSNGQERDELHRAIWSIADDLRGSVDGWDFKSYVLGTMFYRYISENLTNYINKNEQDSGIDDFDYTALSDADAIEARTGLIQEKGFFILPSELFCNVLKNAPRDENLNETLERVFNHIEDSAKGSDAESIIQLGIEFDSPEEVKRVYEMFCDDGAKVDMAICELPWSPCAASVIDRFGVWWYISSASHYPSDDFDPKKPLY